MRQPFSTIALVALAVLFAAQGTTEGQRPVSSPAELKKLHILMVFDTNARELARSLRLDERRLCQLWQETIPQERYSLTILKGDKVSKTAILRHYRDLQVAPGEGLLFYYGGHGATDKRTGEHYFELSDGKALFRRDLVKAMEDRKAALVVLLSDCCSTPKLKTTETVKERKVVMNTRTLHPTVRSLLFTARGTVDITAATDNASWSDNLQGGLFTRSLSRLLALPVKKVDGDRNGTVNWDEFFLQLQKETKSLFESWRKDMTARGEQIESRNQVPHAFKRRLALVGIENGTQSPLTYQVRWPGQDWTAVTLQPRERRIHRLVLTRTEQTVPKLEAKFTGLSKPKLLTAGAWAGLGEPSDPPKLYRVRSRPR